MSLILQIILLCTISIAFGSPVDSALTKPFSAGLENNNRIINGKEALLGQFPHQGALYYNSTFRCGCSLVSRTHVIAAAHCVHGMAEELFEVVLGITIRSELQEGRQTVQVARNLEHPDYEHYPLKNDIAVLELENPVAYTDYIKPIRLTRNPDNIPDGAGLVTSGWGRTDDHNPSVSDKLMFVEVSAVNQDDCRHIYGTIIRDNVICVIEHNRTAGTCSGDSGGPLMAQEDDGSVILVGVTSFNAMVGCVQNYPAGFSRIAEHLGYIQARVTFDD